MRPVHHVTAVASAVEIRVAPASQSVTAVLPAVLRPHAFAPATRAPRSFDGRVVRRMTCTFLT